MTKAAKTSVSLSANESTTAAVKTNLTNSKPAASQQEISSKNNEPQAKKVAVRKGGKTVAEIPAFEKYENVKGTRGKSPTTPAKLVPVAVTKPVKIPKVVPKKTTISGGEPTIVIPSTTVLKKLERQAKPGVVNRKSGTIASLKTTATANFTTTTGLKKIIFQVKYTTVVGQSLFVTGNHVLLGNNDYQKAFPLTYLNNEYWIGTVEITVGEAITSEVTYNYLLQHADGTYSTDWGNDKVISAELFPASEVHFYDMWNDTSLIENTFFTEAFQKVLLKENFTTVPITKPVSTITTHIFRAKAPLLARGQALCLIGSAKALGSWDVENPLLLAHNLGSTWHSVSVDLSAEDFPIAYKYGVYDVDDKKFTAYETNNNRVLYEGISPERLSVVSDGFANILTQPFKGAGVAIPVFSLRSANSFGVGEFADLKLLVDWAKRTGLKLVQLLPVNDTTATHTYTDSYPYAAISAFALHPLYLHLPAVVSTENKDLLASLNDQREALNDKAAVDYLAVMAAKWDLLKQIFPSQKDLTFKEAAFSQFFAENEHWLVPYAAFSFLREKYNTSDFNTWPSHSTYGEAAIKEIAGSPVKAEDAISIYYFVQYHLHLQLKEATAYAHQQGIIVKGDIPIGIYRNSCDAWQEPGLYNMDKQAGAPPDDFAVKGQNWGFPTYNWQRMREDGFEWWKKRFTQMGHYFDAFRIDHILGFFRIWSIPMDAVEGILGHFVPAVPLHISEMHSRGIYFEYNRLCKPYITDNILSAIFGSDTDDVKSQFLQREYDNQYELNVEYNTQRKVEAHFAQREENVQNKKIKEGLYDLISNVVLLEQEGSNGQQFHFRIGMEGTRSFQNLDGNTQQQLRELYLNYFYSRQDDFWRKEAMQKLPELKRSTNMLICGEDLGMVPATVPGVMKELAMLSLEIQRMPKDNTREFFHPNDAPYLSVVTPSTHDMSTIRGWWEEDRAATQRFFINELGQWGTAPYFCEPWINRIILMQHFYSPAMWSIFQLQDLLGISLSLRRDNPGDERINIPADPKHYWRYRMHISLEDLLNQDEFNNEIVEYVTKSRR